MFEYKFLLVPRKLSEGHGAVRLQKRTVVVSISEDMAFRVKWNAMVASHSEVFVNRLPKQLHFQCKLFFPQLDFSLFVWLFENRLLEVLKWLYFCLDEFRLIRKVLLDSLVCNLLLLRHHACFRLFHDLFEVFLNILHISFLTSVTGCPSILLLRLGPHHLALFLPQIFSEIP